MKKKNQVNTDRPDPVAGHPSPKSSRREPSVCGVCNHTVVNKSHHVYKHLRDDLQESRFYCQNPDCYYRAFHSASMVSHLRNHNSKRPILDRKEELAPVYECFGAKEAHSVNKVRGKSLRDDLLSAHKKWFPNPVVNRSPMKRARGSSLGNLTNKKTMDRNIFNDNKKMQFVHYVVTPHDSLGYIAAYHGATKEKLKEINDLDSDTLTPGQIILVPRLKYIDNTVNATPQTDLNNTMISANKLVNDLSKVSFTPATSGYTLVKQEIPDEGRVEKIRLLNMLPKIDANALLLCEFCEKSVHSAFGFHHVYQHLSNHFERHRFLCRHHGCDFGSYTQPLVLRHQKKQHKWAAKKMVLDQTKALEDEAQEYGAKWLGVQRKTKKVAAVAVNDENDAGDEQEMDVENGAQPADDNEQEDFEGDEGMHQLPNEEPEEDVEGEEEHVVITSSFMDDMMLGFLDKELPSKAAVKSILTQAKELLEKESNMVHIQLKEGQELTVCGDLHGQLLDLAQIFMIRGDPSEKSLFLFNGDFVDRGTQGVEVMLALLGYKILYPNALLLNRGNHECSVMNHLHGFEKEVLEKYDYMVYCLFQTVFCALPLCHLIDKRVFVCHGGLCQNEDVTLADIQALNRFVQPPDSGTMCDLLWADPQNECGSKPNNRGISHYFGPDITRKWCTANGIQYIIRSHEEAERGWDMQDGGRCYTVFSASNYGGVGNQGAYVVLTPGFLMPGIESFVVEGEQE